MFAVADIVPSGARNLPGGKYARVFLPAPVAAGLSQRREALCRSRDTYEET